MDLPRSRRSYSPLDRGGARLPSAGLGGSGTGKIYMMLLTLVVVVFFMVMTRGETLGPIDKVLQQPAPPPTAEQLAQRLQERQQYLGGALYDAKDLDDFRETEGYGKLLQSLVGHVSATQAARKPAAFDLELAKRDPEAQRGERVLFRGLLANDDRWQAIRLDKPVFQLTDVWRATLTDGDGENAVVVDFLEQPQAQRRDEVEVDGIFYRLVGFENRQGKRREAPYLLARSLRVLPESSVTGFGMSKSTMMVFAIAIMALVAYGVLRITTASRRSIRPVNFRAAFGASRSSPRQSSAGESFPRP